MTNIVSTSVENLVKFQQKYGDFGFGAVQIRVNLVGFEKAAQ